ncbi:uncharacterized protein BXZ73DRAFT_76480 [Epithele typhae]|uniref:uncharacterized protein n=1 Tax=Epithele typhae TaxID=378194 RepID=UPI002008C307|nr:uncharacterized protein BXZ73DRAFT_76480 [Epithele typhae]KAH9937850.1 hypothetical protein BXZ73DRAFT_76480 [Epithele typhae]
MLKAGQNRTSHPRPAGAFPRALRSGLPLCAAGPSGWSRAAGGHTPHPAPLNTLQAHSHPLPLRLPMSMFDATGDKPRIIVHIPLPMNVDPTFIVPITNKDGAIGLQMSKLMPCWEPYWERRRERAGLQRFDIHQTLSALVHPDHVSTMLSALCGGELIFVDCCPLRRVQIMGEKWGVYGEQSSASTAADLLALIVPAMFNWYDNLVRSLIDPVRLNSEPDRSARARRRDSQRNYPATVAGWRILESRRDWTEWMQRPNLSDVRIVAIRRTLPEGGVRYFPEIVIYPPSITLIHSVSYKVPLPPDVDPNWEIPIDQELKYGLHMKELKCCKRPYLARLNGEVVGPAPDIHQTVQRAVHTAHFHNILRDLAHGHLIFVGPCEIPGDWLCRRSGQTTSAQTAVDLLALIVQASFRWQEALDLDRQGITQKWCCDFLPADFAQWLKDHGDVFLMRLVAIRRSKPNRGEPVRYFPEVFIDFTP